MKVCPTWPSVRPWTSGISPGLAYFTNIQWLDLVFQHPRPPQSGHQRELLTSRTWATDGRLAERIKDSHSSVTVTMCFRGVSMQSLAYIQAYCIITNLSWCLSFGCFQLELWRDKRRRSQWLKMCKFSNAIGCLLWGLQRMTKRDILFPS